MTLDPQPRKKLIVELKAVEALSPVHFAQLRSYLRMAGLPLGLLIHFNVSTLLRGVKRVVCGSPFTPLVADVKVS